MSSTFHRSLMTIIPKSYFFSAPHTNETSLKKGRCPPTLLVASSIHELCFHRASVIKVRGGRGVPFSLLHPILTSAKCDLQKKRKRQKAPTRSVSEFSSLWSSFDIFFVLHFILKRYQVIFAPESSFFFSCCCIIASVMEVFFFLFLMSVFVWLIIHREWPVFCSVHLSKQ